MIWNQRVRLGLALPPPQWVALGKALCLSEPRVSHRSHGNAPRDLHRIVIVQEGGPHSSPWQWPSERMGRGSFLVRLVLLLVVTCVRRDFQNGRLSPLQSPLAFPPGPAGERAHRDEQL